MSPTTRNDRLLSLHELKRRIAEDDIDTVVVAFTDMQGRLQGKRMHATYFVDHVLEHGTEDCDYLLAVDLEMNPLAGIAESSEERCDRDLLLVLDTGTIRLLRHLPATAMVQCDLAWSDGSAVAASPRTILQRQVAGAADRGFVALSGVELEFLVFEASYVDAWQAGYRGLRPASRYNVDYSILGSSRIEPLLRDIRNTCYRAGMDVESAKGEGDLGQYKIRFPHADLLTTADNHVVYKTIAKEIADTQRRAITFMACYDERAGSACHINLSLRDRRTGDHVFWAAEGRTPVYDSFIAGVLTTMADFALLYAPNINSYKRFTDGPDAWTAIAWAEDNNAGAVRLVGRGARARLENRVPGADVNPYLALAAMLAGGLYGIDHELDLPDPVTSHSHAVDRPQLPRTLRDARDAFGDSTIARELLGDEVVDHYTAMADAELAAFDRTVTDWERYRFFERI
jgi:glutamine synthetase